MSIHKIIVSVLLVVFIAGCAVPTGGSNAAEVTPRSERVWSRQAKPLILVCFERDALLRKLDRVESVRDFLNGIDARGGSCDYVQLPPGTYVGDWFRYRTRQLEFVVNVLYYPGQSRPRFAVDAVYEVRDRRDDRFDQRHPRYDDRQRYDDPRHRRGERNRLERQHRDDRGAGTRAKDRVRKWLKDHF